MSTVNEVPRILTWLRTVLAADATLSSAVGGRIYEGHVPEGKAFPAVVYAVLAFPDDVAGGHAVRIWSKAVVLVKGVTEANTSLPLQTIADRIDAVLQSAKGGVADVDIDYCVRRRPFYLKDASVLNKVYVHLGGEYELAARYAA